MNSSTEIICDDKKFTIVQQSIYPWDGDISLILSGESDIQTVMMLRIPGWANNRPVPGDLYRYAKQLPDTKPVITINDDITDYDIVRGYAAIKRKWQPGDVIVFHLPMPVRHVVAHDKVLENRGRIAFERGPLVYCAEGVDNNGQAFGMSLNEEIHFNAEHDEELLGGVTVLQSSSATLVPYHVWGHRGAGEMQVWFHNE